MRLLEKNREKIDWYELSKNSSIFTKNMNYKYLYQRMNVIREYFQMKLLYSDITDYGTVGLRHPIMTEKN
jgi:hypothetical protein